MRPADGDDKKTVHERVDQLSGFAAEKLSIAGNERGTACGAESASSRSAGYETEGSFLSIVKDVLANGLARGQSIDLDLPLNAPICLGVMKAVPGHKNLILESIQIGDQTGNLCCTLAKENDGSIVLSGSELGELKFNHKFSSQIEKLYLRKDKNDNWHLGIEMSNFIPNKWFPFLGNLRKHFHQQGESIKEDDVLTIPKNIGEDIFKE